MSNSFVIGSVHELSRVQIWSATPDLKNTWLGIWYPSLFLGRLFNLSIAILISCCIIVVKSRLLGSTAVSIHSCSRSYRVPMTNRGEQVEISLQLAGDLCVLNDLHYPKFWSKRLPLHLERRFHNFLVVDLLKLSNDAQPWIAHSTFYDWSLDRH